MVLTLFVISAVAAVALGFVYYFTKAPIEQVKKDILTKALGEVLPEFNTQETDTIYGNAVYRAYDANNQLVGVAVESESNGFGGPIKLLVGFKNDGTIFGYSVLKHTETAGLGSKMGTWFQKDAKGDVIGKDLSTPVKVKKDGGDIDAITASTISSIAFCDGLNSAYETYKKAIESNSATVETPATETAEVQPEATQADSTLTATADSTTTEVITNDEGGNK